MWMLDFLMKLKSYVFGFLFLPTLLFAGDLHHLTFLHFNDIYQLKEHERSPGFARLKTLINQYKAKDKNTVVTFGGDLVPAAAGRVPIGLKEMMDFLNELPLDLAVPGNHEFDSGAEEFLEQLKITKHRWLAANIYDLKRKSSFMNKQHIMEVDGLKVGFFGLITQHTKFISKAGDSVKFENYIKSAQENISHLKEKNVDLIVALTHLSVEEDIKLATACQDINLILGGHDHNPYTNMVGNTLIHKSGVNGEYLGIIELEYDPETKATFYQWQMKSPMTAEPNLRLKYEIVALEQTFMKKFNKVIAELNQDLSSLNRVVRQNETHLGNLVADGLRDHFDSDIGFINSGTFRGDRIYKKGSKITMTDVIVELPFKNRVVEVNMTGLQFKELIREAFVRAKESGAFPNVSGATIQYDVAKNQLKNIMINDHPIRDQKTYRVATVDYLVRGGDGIQIFKTFTDETKLPGSKIISEVMIDYLQKIKQVSDVQINRLNYV